MNEQASWVDIVAEVVHDLKTPLTSAKGFLDLLQNCGDPLTTRQEHFANRTQEALERMEVLVGHLLEIAWIDAERPLEPKACELDGLIERAVRSLSQLAERKTVTFHTEVDPQIGSVEADERRLEQILLNLMSNAIKYNRPQGDVWVKAVGRADSVEVAVRDSGRGISPEALPHVFDRFFREQHGGQRVEGTGLGLTIVKALIEKHGGRIWVESTLGEGSTFTFMLPRVPRLNEGRDAAREIINEMGEQPEHMDFESEDSNETIDSVDDNLQEPPQMSIDMDINDVAEQQ